MELSNRLSAVAKLVSTGNRVADIGTDHGYVPIFLVESRHIPKAIAMDVNQGPLERAREHIRLHHLEEYIETRLSDGLHALKPGEADTIVIAGMGGPLMMRILQQGQAVRESIRELVLQPQSEIGEFRRELLALGCEIIQEDMVFEDGKFYPVIQAVPGNKHSGSEKPYREIEYQYGRFLLQRKHPVLKQYLQKEQKTVSSILLNLQKECSDSPAGQMRRGKLEKRLSAILEALNEM